MQKRWIFIALFIVLLFIGGNIAYWTQAVAPKETRLAYYAARVTAQNSRDHNAFEMSNALSALDGINLAHLTRCEQIAFHNIRANYRRRIENKNSPLVANSTALQRVAARYLGYTPTLETLKGIGEAEFAAVSAEIADFAKALPRESGVEALDKIANNPERQTNNRYVIEDYYTEQLRALSGRFDGRFYDYDYDLPETRVILRPGLNRYAAAASYDNRKDAMVVYAGIGDYDLNIARFITVHEIVPGHHLDFKGERGTPICLENGTTTNSWLMEGWATYGEFIADEEGFFDDPGHRLAWLDYRLIRAMRIIADVERAENYADKASLRDLWGRSMPRRLHNSFEDEYTRLTQSRHQHVSYILGYQAIIDACKQLEKTLGPSFDEPAFHDVLLRMTHCEPAALYDTVLIGMELASEAAAESREGQNK